jgi:hypothetical protein
VANQNSYLPTYRSGFTGPSDRIGGSSEYHIDLKILNSLPLQEKLRALDSLANQYKSIGRAIEFSNAAVSGRRWDPNATPEQKKALFEAASAAHRARPGWDPLDFYVPFIDKSRFDKGAVEGASIYIPGVPGGKITRGSGGGYGYFSEALDPSGRVVFRVGHGDINRPEKETEVLVTGEAAPATTTTATAQNGKSAEELLVEKLGELLKPRTRVAPVEYQGPSEEYFAKAADAIDQATLNLMLENAKAKEQQAQMPAYAPSSAGPAAAMMAQQAFLTPKSTI